MAATNGRAEREARRRQAVVPDNERFQLVQPRGRRLVAAEIEHALNAGNERIEGAVDEEGRALKPQRAHAFGPQALEERTGNATLAEARLTRQQHRLAGAPIADRLPALEQRLHLVGPSDKGRHRLPDDGVKPAGRRADPQHIVRARGRGNAFQVQLTQILIVELPAREPVDPVAHHDASRLADPLQPGRPVPGFAPDIALAGRHHDDSSGNADSHSETADLRYFEVRYRLDDFQPCPDRAGSLALVRQGEAEECQDAVTEQAVDVAVVAADAGGRAVFVF